MPQVGTGKSAKHFSYGAKGQAAAKRAAKRTGKKVVNVKRKRKR